MNILYLPKLPLPGSSYFSNRPSTARDILVGDLLAAELQRADGVGEGTKNKENRVWTRWCEYCRIICNEHDIFLADLTLLRNRGFVLPITLFVTLRK